MFKMLREQTTAIEILILKNVLLKCYILSKKGTHQKRQPDELLWNERVRPSGVDPKPRSTPACLVTTQFALSLGTSVNGVAPCVSRSIGSSAQHCAARLISAVCMTTAVFSLVFHGMHVPR